MPIPSLVERAEETQCEGIFSISLKASLSLHWSHQAHFAAFRRRVSSFLYIAIRWDLQQCWVPSRYLWMTWMYLFTGSSLLHQELPYYTAVGCKWSWWYENEDHESWGIRPSTRKVGYDSLRLVGIVGKSILGLDMRDLPDAPGRNLPHVQRCGWRSLQGQWCHPNSGYSPGGQLGVARDWWADDAMHMQWFAGLGEFVSFDTRRPVFWWIWNGRLRMRGPQAVEAFAKLMVPKDWIWTRGTWDTRDTSDRIGDGMEIMELEQMILVFYCFWRGLNMFECRTRRAVDFAPAPKKATGISVFVV